MKSKRSRLALVGVLALALSVTVGLASGSVADAKKKKKKKAVTSVTVSKTTSTSVPPSTAASGGTAGKRSLVTVPLAVGTQASKKVVSLDTLTVNYKLTGPAATVADPAAASNLRLSLTAPNGRTINVTNPGAADSNASTIGPVTVTPNSPFGVCAITVTPPPGPSTCSTTTIQDPENTVKPPDYTGTIGQLSLAGFGGIAAMGTWTAKVRNFSTVTTGELSNITLTIGLAPAPSTTTKKKKKK